MNNHKAVSVYMDCNPDDCSCHKHHTPGPWTACPLSGERNFKFQITSDVPGSRHIGWIADGRNAALIAAAPDMLEALRAALGELEGHGARVEIIQAVDCAIAKAEGRK